MGAGYLADSNVVIDLMLGRFPSASAAWLDQQLGQRLVDISVITRIELLTKAEPANEYAVMQALVQSVAVLPPDEPVIQQPILLRQQNRIKLPDAVIAATALVYNRTLITRNEADFSNIAGLTVWNLHDAPKLPGFRFNVINPPN